MYGSSIERVLEESRRHLDRVEPDRLTHETAAGAVVVDIRPAASRAAEGPLPGAVVLERTVLEWRLDPTSPDRIPEADDPDCRIIVVCDEGYSSSLAAEMLQRLGLRGATDLVGGYRAWRLLTRAVAAPPAPSSRNGAACPDAHSVVEPLSAAAPALEDVDTWDSTRAPS